MGATGSVESLTSEITTSDMSGKDIDTPRGVSAKQEVVRLRTVLVERGMRTIQAIAHAKFEELDVDKSGYLENEELLKVTDWVMLYFGDKMGSDPGAVRKKIMQRLDANNDGKLDLAEFEELFNMILQRMSIIERARAKFKEMDTDKSNFLEKEEINAVIEWSLQAFPADDDLTNYKKKLLADIDKNGDGKLDQQEFVVLFEEMLVRMDLIHRARAKFVELDTDKSGMLETQELDKVAEWVLQAYSDKSVGDRAAFKETLMKRIDVNQDGKLSMQEFAVVFDEILLRMDLHERAKKQFQVLDADGSGFLEKSELGGVLKIWAKACGAELNIDPSASLEDLLAKVDANSDGKLELAEFIPLFDKVVQTSGIWG